MLRTIVGVVVLVGGAFSLATGCSEQPIACTEIGCIGSLTVSVQGPLEGSNAHFELTVDDETATCDVDLATSAATCDPELSMTVASDGFTLTRSLGMGVTTADVALVISVDDQSVFSGDLDVAWGEPDYPNGAACGGGCVSATAEVTPGG